MKGKRWFPSGAAWRRRYGCWRAGSAPSGLYLISQGMPIPFATSVVMASCGDRSVRKLYHISGLVRVSAVPGASRENPSFTPFPSLRAFNVEAADRDPGLKIKSRPSLGLLNGTCASFGAIRQDLQQCDRNRSQTPSRTRANLCGRPTTLSPLRLTVP